jgi:hypothetical protein
MHKQLTLIANIRNLLEIFVEFYCGLKKTALYFQDSNCYIMERFQNICRSFTKYLPDIQINTPVLLRYDICVCPLVTGHATSFFTCIHMAAGSSLCQNTKYPHSGFLWLSSVPPGKFQDKISN